ncbi:4-alpha-glucanotransferase [Sanguibacter gelidistatuariae]|uniref:4-alpha-glucanotransferase n=1 Tax=Sanguibacter gelidistatuariae TaxID=1814289 RepID=A0A1G6N9E7_9MICO|nr:4-alpha-glucanotransferase [Sanguibacter gelidistatuariae]SDC63866.1 4-alpha-glucanotransferase [Sanguibacter gelidistatuariae]
MDPAEHATPSPALIDLARAYGVSPDHFGFHGESRTASTDTLTAVLAALGVDASTPERIDVALASVVDAPWRRMLPATLVLREGQAQKFPVHVTDGMPVEVWIELEGHGGRIDLEQIDLYTEPRTVDGRTIGRAMFEVPRTLPLGWHEVRAATPDGQSRATLAVTPVRLELPADLAGRQSWGLMAQLYSVRSRQSWGVGDFADLADLGWIGGKALGADFLLINPVAAAEPTTPMTPSPYLPVSRRFINPLYLRVEDIRETAYLSAADRSIVEWSAEGVRELSTDPGPIDRDASWDAKKAALQVVFEAPRSAARQTAFGDFRASQGRGLEDFATWCAFTEHFGGAAWPPALRDPAGDEVAALRVELAQQIDFHCWLQWVADVQLEQAQRSALEGGMAIGIMHDLAVGVHPEGSDAWALGSVLAHGIGVGAPPDMYNQQGQNWSQPPWHPEELARTGYAAYRDLLRTVLRHAGALRIDHVIGLFRLWWIPEGNGADEGVYVRYDHEALIGILCLEAHRAGAVVIGEDLGVFEPWVRDYLTDRGILGTSILWFEQESDGRPLAPEHYRALSLTTVTTHDLPPSAGYLAGEQVELRDRLGLLTEPVQLVRQQARRERDQMILALATRGLIDDDPSERELVEALHRYIKATPAVLLGVSLADAVGERRAQNQPGTDQQYPNWKVPLGDSSGNVVLIEDLLDNARLLSLAAVMNEDDLPA